MGGGGFTSYSSDHRKFTSEVIFLILPQDFVMQASLILTNHWTCSDITNELALEGLCFELRIVIALTILFPCDCRGERGELALNVFLLTWLLPTYGDDDFMLHIYHPEWRGGPSWFKNSWQIIFEPHEYTFLIKVRPILYFHRNVASVAEVFNFVNKV